VSVPAYIGFGSNLGELVANYAEALRKISSLPGVSSVKSSPLYHSEPLSPDGEFQPWYLNAVFEIVTSLAPHELLYALKKIEKDMGRVMRRKWAPRLVDLDILFYDRLIYRDGVIGIPHGEIANRRFVLKPLSDLAPDFVHPEFGLSVRELLAVSNDPLRVVPYAEAERVREA
jgi:2-amino-4-hydroxy-6-hydroxymethyldihydropteridine diphosphokinase